MINRVNKSIFDEIGLIENQNDRKSSSQNPTLDPKFSGLISGAYTLGIIGLGKRAKFKSEWVNFA